MAAELSLTPAEKARKAHGMVLRAMEEPGTGRGLAQVLGTSEATVSRIKTEKLEDVLVLLYQLGFKVVEGTRICVARDRYEAMVTIARAAMACPETARSLIWEGE
jgi:hypothetical protein